MKDHIFELWTEKDDDHHSHLHNYKRFKIQFICLLPSILITFTYFNVRRGDL